ncbi:MAG: YciI family protein [Niabella sp.]
MFIVSLNYKKDMDEVEKYLGQHVAFLDKYYSLKKFIFSGRKNPRTGGIILVRDANAQEVKTIIEEDPFYKNKIAEYEITEFIPTKFDEAFACFVNN